jgi:hypothetical protein
MAEIIGAGASIITIWECAYKMLTIRAEAKAAPAEWQRYRDGLLMVAGVCTALSDTYNATMC